jgi:hypothetical protein
MLEQQRLLQGLLPLQLSIEVLLLRVMQLIYELIVS